MKGNLRCVEGRLYRHDPQHDDPYLETEIGQCPDCSGGGCDDLEATPPASCPRDNCHRREPCKPEFLCDYPDTPRPAASRPDVAEAGKLTPEYLAMTPLQKWETLTLHGLLGTDEPWIDDMRETLRLAALGSAPPAQQIAESANCSVTLLARQIVNQSLYGEDGNRDETIIALDAALSRTDAQTKEQSAGKPEPAGGGDG